MQTHGGGTEARYHHLKALVRVALLCIEGVPMEHYIAWMRSAYYLSATFHPAVSVPAGFTADGLPVGLQIVGRHGDDLGVLQLAHAFEAATGVGKRRPREA